MKNIELTTSLNMPATAISRKTRGDIKLFSTRNIYMNIVLCVVVMLTLNMEAASATGTTPME